MDDCIFCKIVKKEIPANIVCETDSLLVFPDIHPSAKFHLLIVPKEHIKSFADLKENHEKLVIEVYRIASKLVTDNNLEDDFYRVVVNGGKAQHIPHIHFHFLGGKLEKMV